MKKYLFVIAPLALLSACATPETRLRNGLQDAGLSAATASCMANRMVNELSYTQLRRISSLSTLKGQRMNELSAAEFMHKVRALKDPEIIAETGRAAAICALAR
ncbi:hypothetical protein [Sphingomonas sp. C3-2]|uniref:hypothetical protein n=1 Tax=Sphingomonas sp. C3-2 TaxID=3062169 RepID=UPI00294AFBD2|nr:hypothetical protein [Sphingomonas sp. C3-2]WOK37858.1 hypothetical protein QYC26_06640 [Sphingomonas sp. C3-2]